VIFTVKIETPPNVTARIAWIAENYDCMVEYYDPISRKQGTRLASRQELQQLNPGKFFLFVLLYELGIRRKT